MAQVRGKSLGAGIEKKELEAEAALAAIVEQKDAGKERWIVLVVTALARAAKPATRIVSR